ncbi:hypothetical protein AMTR_s00045p00046500 [Amborella trichopoda]|uniref:Uncharacterized protein n=1 Tax=Amborella trichopoda TaxID=13333 RepID=W1NWD6_AMBTC|nr:hypothetical protein AMTR_s00045p00046500 [Amborella trichopoda]
MKLPCLEQLLLVAASFGALVDGKIGDTYLALGRSDQAVSAYERALHVLKEVYGEGHTEVASIAVSLADAYLRRGSLKEAKIHCEIIYYTNIFKFRRQQEWEREMVVVGLSRVACLLEAMGEAAHAMSVLQKGHELLLLGEGGVWL